MKKLANCKRCKLRSACIAPCQALIDYLQRKVPPNKNELYIGTPSYIMLDKLPSMESTEHLTRMEKVILTLELMKWDRVAIAKLFGIQRDSVRKYIYSARKKILRKS